MFDKRVLPEGTRHRVFGSRTPQHSGGTHPVYVVSHMWGFTCASGLCSVAAAAARLFAACCHHFFVASNELSLTPIPPPSLYIYIHTHTHTAAKYYYPHYYLGWDITIDFLYVIVESTRLLMASKANKTASVYAMVCSLVLGVPILVAHSYFITLQTYVLRVDVVINSIAFIVVGLQMLVGALTLSQLFLASRKF